MLLPQKDHVDYINALFKIHFEIWNTQIVSHVFPSIIVKDRQNIVTNLADVQKGDKIFLPLSFAER